jgi:hypothetical protein
VHLGGVRGQEGDHAEFRHFDGSPDPAVVRVRTRPAAGMGATIRRVMGTGLILDEDSPPGFHPTRDFGRDVSSHLDLADHLFHRAAGKAPAHRPVRGRPVEPARHLRRRSPLAFVIRNTSAMDDVPDVPLRGDGRPYRFEMIYAGGGLRAYADEPAELVDVLSPGYGDLPGDDERRDARVGLVLDAQVRVQALLATADAGEPLRDCTEEERAVLLGGRHVPPSPATWTAPVPLVLVATFYRPAGTLPRPEGPAELQIWLDPADDWTLLVSLHEAGVIQLAARQDPA